MRLYHLKYIPVIDPFRCSGCHECIAACQPGVLQADGRKASVCRPELCDSDGGCVASCPDEAIRMRWTEVSGDETVGLWQRVYV